MFFGMCLYKIQGSCCFLISSNKADADAEAIFDEPDRGTTGFCLFTIARYIGEY
jgi:hypothetical protein